ncbi:MAG TPA: hypothetical protein VH393_10850 [Ktedonobacterales bacterium]
MTATMKKTTPTMSPFRLCRALYPGVTLHMRRSPRAKYQWIADVRFLTARESESLSAWSARLAARQTALATIVGQLGAGQYRAQKIGVWMLTDDGMMRLLDRYPWLDVSVDLAREEKARTIADEAREHAGAA